MEDQKPQNEARLPEEENDCFLIGFQQKLDEEKRRNGTSMSESDRQSELERIGQEMLESIKKLPPVH